MRTIVIACILSLAFASQYVPIPNVYDGVHVGDAAATLHVEAFYDLLCPDSKASNAILNDVFNQATYPHVKFTYHLFPLPYHIQAYYAAIGTRFFLKKYGAEAAKFYINYVFLNQDSLSGGAVFNKTQAQVLDEFAEGVATFFQRIPQYAVSQEAFVAALQNRQFDLETRTSWKYGTSRGISGTPIFLANGVVIDGAEGWQAEQWQSFFEARAPTKTQEAFLE